MNFIILKKFQLVRQKIRYRASHIFRCFLFSLWYGAVVYFKSITSNKSAFVLSQSRLSLIKEKKKTTPRLELQATVTLITAVKLKDKIVEIFDIQFISIKFWVLSDHIKVYTK